MLWTLDVSQVWELSGIELNCVEMFEAVGASVMEWESWQHDSMMFVCDRLQLCTSSCDSFSLVHNIHVVYVLHCVLICVLHCVLHCTLQFVNYANLPAWECWKWTGISVRFDNISGPPVQLLIRFSVIGTVGLPTGCRCAAAQVVIKNLTVTVHLKIIWTAVNRQHVCNFSGRCYVCYDHVASPLLLWRHVAVNLFFRQIMWNMSCI